MPKLVSPPSMPTRRRRRLVLLVALAAGVSTAAPLATAQAASVHDTAHADTTTTTTGITTSTTGTGTTTTGTTGTTTTGTTTTGTGTTTSTTGTTSTSTTTTGSTTTISSTSATTKALTTLQKTLRTDLLKVTRQGSVLVYDSTTGKTLYSYAPNTGRLPASVQKLYTTTTALLKFGANATLQTQVYGVGTLSADGTYAGTLYLKGGGDPTFGEAAFNSLMYGTGASVQSLASALKADGITKINGAVLGDGSYFDSLGGGPATGYQANTETEGLISALAFDSGFTSSNENALQAHPVTFAAQALVAALQADGISVPSTTTVGFGTTPSTATQLASVSSPTMATLAQLTNSPSNDFFAEMLLKGLGKRYGTAGSTAAGAAVVRATVASRLGLYPRLNDGSGLSRYDRTTATQIVSLLRQMRSNSAFYNSLAIAGVRGTMRYEMLHTRAVDNCRGKTGTLHDVANLVGYCTARDGHRLIFAFLMNGLPYDYTYAHQVEDLMGVALANYNAPSGTASVHRR